MTPTLARARHADSVATPIFAGFRKLVSGRNLSTSEKGADMLAAMGLGVIGTILVIAVVIALIMFFVRRA
jgi:hypothetical protein